MRRPFARSRALFLLPLLAALAACQDETPTLSGDDLFPGGRPQTLEVIVPASQFLTLQGVYTGFADRSTLGGLVVANRYEGVLDAHTLLRPTFPRTVTYSQDGASREDSLYTLRGATLTLLADSAATDAPGATVRVFDLAQGFEFTTVSWTVAADTGATTIHWTVPGGTPGPFLGEASYQPGTPGDSINVALDSVAARRLRDDAATSGALIRLGTAGSRLELRNAVLTARVRPSNAVRDTTLEVNIPVFATFIYTPEPPRSPGRLEAGGVRAARSIFSVDLDRTVPGCAAGETCAAVPLSEVLVNRVSLLFRPVASPAGFEPVGTVPLTLWTVSEPELGPRAPLGELVNDAFVATGPVATYQPGEDDEVEVPFTAYANEALRADSLPTTFALLGEAPPVSGSPDRNFGVSVFESEPRLRIVYTLPIRPRLP